MVRLFCLNLFCSAVTPKTRWYLFLPNIQHNTILWHGSRIRNECHFFSIQITPTVKKSNPATEPHCSPQGCTVRPRKGAGQSSIGGGGEGGRVFSVSLLIVPGGVHCLPNLGRGPRQFGWVWLDNLRIKWGLCNCGHQILDYCTYFWLLVPWSLFKWKKSTSLTSVHPM
jgi:hypothetical protein